MRPSLDLANFLTPEPFPNGDVSNYLKLWEFAPEFASTPSTQGPHGLKLWCGDKFPRAYNSFIKFLNKGRGKARELVNVPLRDIKYFAVKFLVAAEPATFTVRQKYVTACGK